MIRLGVAAVRISSPITHIIRSALIASRGDITHSASGFPFIHSFIVFGVRPSQAFIHPIRVAVVYSKDPRRGNVGREGVSAAVAAASEKDPMHYLRSANPLIIHGAFRSGDPRRRDKTRS